MTAFAAAQGLTYPLISILLEKAKVSPAVAGLNSGVYSVGLAVSSLIACRLTRAIRAGSLIFSGLGGCACCLSVFGSTDLLWAWFLARFALGLFSNLILITSEAWLHSACADQIRGRVSGLYSMGIGFGFAIGPLAIPYFGTSGGFTFTSMSIYAASVAVATLVLNKRTRSQPAQVPAGTTFFWFFLHAPVLIVMVFAFAFSYASATSTMPTYFLRHGYSDDFAATSVTVLAFALAISQPVVGVLLDKWSREGVAIVSAIVASLAFLVIPFIVSPGIILLTFSILGAACFSINTCALTLLGQRFTGAALTAGTSAFALAYAIGSAGGSSLTGFVMEFVGTDAAPAGTGALLLCLALFLVLRH
ncbi:MFS transporter [Ensifer aridi]|uniref:MFS transporter n=1 Tax=Ensifer aridi TaxID=1708715 RepID=UPI0015E46FBA|nr:MFS transporter [Ensifer aridi]